jgi:hypothetical protein
LAKNKIIYFSTFAFQDNCSAQIVHGAISCVGHGRGNQQAVPWDTCVAHRKWHLLQIVQAAIIPSMLPSRRTDGPLPRLKQDRVPPKTEEGMTQSVRDAELLALFRLLTREPPPDHDFKTCPICKRYGITSI